MSGTYLLNWVKESFTPFMMTNSEKKAVLEDINFILKQYSIGYINS